MGQELVIDGIDEDNVQQGIKVNINTLALTSITSGGQESIEILKEKYGTKEILLKKD